MTKGRIIDRYRDGPDCFFTIGFIDVNGYYAKSDVQFDPEVCLLNINDYVDILYKPIKIKSVEKVNKNESTGIISPDEMYEIFQDGGYSNSTDNAITSYKIKLVDVKEYSLEKEKLSIGKKIEVIFLLGILLLLCFIVYLPSYLK